MNRKDQESKTEESVKRTNNEQLKKSTSPSRSSRSISMMVSNSLNQNCTQQNSFPFEPCQSMLKSAKNLLNAILRGCSEEPKESESQEAVNKSSEVLRSSTSSRVAVVTSSNKVFLNVYSLTQVNQVISYTGLGIYHSGVEVYGQEWAYGGYPDPICSIFRMKQPKDISSLSDISGKFHFYQSIEMGSTKYTYREVEAILINLGRGDWIGTKYHLLNHNCNCFSNELCKILVGKPIPSWVNRPATVFSRLPWNAFLMVPDEYITPVALVRQAQRQSNKKSDKVRVEMSMMRERQRKTIKKDFESANTNRKSVPRSKNSIKVSTFKAQRSTNIFELPKEETTFRSIRTDPISLELKSKTQVSKFNLHFEFEKTQPTLQNASMEKISCKTKTEDMFKFEKTLPNVENNDSNESVISKNSDELLQ